jgi:hypothetical protein
MMQRCPYCGRWFYFIRVHRRLCEWRAAYKQLLKLNGQK